VPKALKMLRFCRVRRSTTCMLNYLHIVLAREGIPQALLRDRLALRAAEALVAFSGRPEREGELRDAVHLLRPGDLPGPAGETYIAWHRAVERKISIKALGRALPALAPGQIAACMDAGKGAPVARVATVLEAVLREVPCGEGAALILADAVFAKALGWEHLLPLLAAGLKRADLRKVAKVAGAWMMRTRSAYAPAIRAAADVGVGMPL
jgi:uncharacterized protein DUF1403